MYVHSDRLAFKVGKHDICIEGKHDICIEGKNMIFFQKKGFAL